MSAVVITQISSSQTLDLGYTLFEINASGGSLLLKLPSSSDQTGNPFRFRRIDGSLLNSVTLAAATGETILGVASVGITTVAPTLAIYGCNNDTNWARLP